MSINIFFFTEGKYLLQMFIKINKIKFLEMALGKGRLIKKEIFRNLMQQKYLYLLNIFVTGNILMRLKNAKSKRLLNPLYYYYFTVKL